MIQHLIPEKQLSNGVYLYGRLIDQYIKGIKTDQNILHAELGYGEHELFWQVRDIIQKNPSTKLVLTIHDAPMVIGKPFAQWLPGGFILTKAARKLLDIIFGKRLVAKLVHRADAIIVLNTAVADSLLSAYRIKSDQITVSALPSLTPLPKQEAKKHPQTNLLFFGNISPRKGLDVLIQALHTLESTPLQLDVVGGSAGNSSYLGLVKRAIQDLPPAVEVKLHGFLSEKELGRRIVDADGIVLPYRSEGVIHASGPLATSMSAGKAIICSDVAAFSDVVDNQTGLVFKEGSADQLAERIVRLVSDKGLREQLGEAASNWSNKETSRVVITKALQEVYRSL